MQFNNVGDTAVGTVTNIEVRQGRNGDVPVVTIANADGEEHEIWCGAAWLRSEMARANPQVGDKVRVELIELRQVGQPSPMKVFTVAVKLGEAAPPAPESDPGSEPF